MRSVINLRETQGTPKVNTRYLESPYLLALLVGLYPALFYLSNNWFMFTPLLSLVILVSITLVTFFVLVTFYSLLAPIIRNFLKKNPEKFTQRLFVFTSIFVWAYLLRKTFFELAKHQIGLVLLLVLLTALIVAWFIPRIRIFRLNMILMFLCLISVFGGLVSVATTDMKGVSSNFEPPPTHSNYQQVTFSKKPNVYYIIPDSYPNREALERIYNWDNNQFYQQLESAGFSVHHSAFANYVSTLSSVSSTFGMGHHYYRGSIGNSELIGSRKFISSQQNPTVSIFKNNGYRIQYVHETAYLLKKGCFVDLCSPRELLDDALEILVPYRFKSSFDFLVDQAGFEERIQKSIDETLRSDQPQFSFVHMFSPGHSHTFDQSVEGLADFRRNFFEKVQDTNSILMKLVKRIEQQDPNALIIINGDHGGFGLGYYGFADSEVFAGVPVNSTVLDHMGVLLAIRWPDGVPAYDADIKTNVNLFRYIFAYLSEDEAILKTNVRDDGYLLMEPKTVYQVLRNGKILDPVVAMGAL